MASLWKVDDASTKLLLTRMMDIMLVLEQQKMQ